MYIVERYQDGVLNWQEKCFTFGSAQKLLTECFCVNIEDGLLDGGDTAKLCSEYAEICYRDWKNNNPHILQFRIVKADTQE